HEREPPRLEGERLGARRRLQPPLELPVLSLEVPHFRAPPDEHVARVQVRLERPEVEERDQDEPDDREPAQDDARTWCSPPAARGPRRHPSRVRGGPSRVSP